MKYIITIILALTLTGSLAARDYDYDKILKDAGKYTVEVKIQTKISFGTQNTEVESRGIGTVVTPDGMVIFDGRPIDSDDPFSTMTGMQVSAEPTRIEVKFLDGRKYDAEYIGVDRFTKLGFAKIITEKKEKFDYLQFQERKKFQIGDMLISLMLLPEYVDPPLSVDVGMVTARLAEPEKFILTVGFNELELVSVLYDSTGAAVGMLGYMTNPNLASMSPNQMVNPFENMDNYFPLLGVISVDKIEKLIEDPPSPGKVTRGWLGIYLQALTPDIAEFWGINAGGGIIVNEVVEDSPADSAGFKTGDIIVTLNEKEIAVDKEENIPIFQREISEMGAGAEVDFGVLRREDGKVDTLDMNVTLASAPITPSEAKDYEDKQFEIKVRNMVYADYSIYNLNRNDFKGVVVKEVESGGWASVGGIIPGDIIQSIDGQDVGSVEDAENVFNRLEKEKPKEVVFFIWRNNKTLFINIKTDW